MTSPADTRPPLVRRATAAVRLAFSAAPATTTLLIGLSVVEGLLPVVVAWCLKLLLDELSRGGDAALSTVAAATAGLAGAGLLMGMRQSVDAYLSSMVRVAEPAPGRPH